MSRPQKVEHLETHISHDFLAGNDVYKLKKTVKFDFLDFSTRGEIHREHIRRLVGMLAEFYGTLEPVAMTPEDYRSRVFRHIRGNRLALVALSNYLPQSTVKRVHCYHLQLLYLQPGLFDQRIKAGQIVEGHGDLRPERGRTGKHARR